MIDRPDVILINDSPDQIRETLTWMARLAHEQKAWPQIVNLARGAVDGAYGAAEESEAVRRFVKSAVVYRMDPDGVEYLQAPDKTLQAGAGDCDDMACLAHALLAAIGHQCEPLGVCWRGGNGASHAVIIDLTSDLIVDPVADVPCHAWPPYGYEPAAFVRGA